jgi:hypothetical protein
MSCRFGAYPTPDTCPIDYEERLSKTAYPVPIVQTKIESNIPLEPKILDHQSIAFFSRIGLSRHHSVRPGWDYPGIFYGDSSNVIDLVRHWNLRACDI